MQDFIKKQGETLDYVIDWTDYLGGDAIVSSTWDAFPSDDIIAESPADTNTAVSTTVWLTGGTQGQKYTVENTITTAAGRVIQDEIYVFIREVSS